MIKAGKGWQSIAAGLFLALLALLLFQKAMLSSINHDEHQFVAPPVLMAREGALPYRDFALLHMPNLAFVYALLNQTTTHHLLAARLFSAACAWALVALVFWHCRKVLAGFAAWPRLGLAAGLAMLMVCSPLFVLTAARTWNHDLPVLLVLLAFLAHDRAAGSATRRHLWLLASGAGVGLAIGTRLTFAPILAPFGLAVLLLPQTSWRRRLVAALWFSAGVVVTLLPSLYFAGALPEQFYYGNFESNRLRLLDPTDARAQKTISKWRKVRFFVKEIMAKDVPLFLAVLGIGVPGLIAAVRRRMASQLARISRPVSAGALLLVLLLPFLFAGAMAPTRFQLQHYYALLPFLVLAVAYGLVKLKSRGPLAATALALLMLVAVAMAVPRYRAFAKPTEIGEWVPMRAHRIGRELGATIGRGDVLTFAPIFPLEGRLKIYPELAVGPFAYRLGHLIPKEKRRRLKIIAAEDLNALMDHNPPEGILLGAESREVERELAAYAKSHGFVQAKNFDDMQLWLPATAP